MTRKDTRRRGQSLLEFTLVGIPMIFVLISIFEIARGMWIYNTAAYAVKEGTRLAIVKGDGYFTALTDQNNVVTVRRIVQEIKYAGVGLDITDPDSEIRLTWIGGGLLTCKPISACLADTSRWPPESASGPDLQVGIEVVVPFRSALAMFWPGGGPAQVFGVKWFRARSEDRIQF